MKYDVIKTLLSKEAAGRTVTVCGWVRTFRNDQFIALNDGSTISNLQLVINRDEVSEDLRKKISTGAALTATGMLAE